MYILIAVDVILYIYGNIYVLYSLYASYRYYKYDKPFRFHSSHHLFAFPSMFSQVDDKTHFKNSLFICDFFSKTDVEKGIMDVQSSCPDTFLEGLEAVSLREFFLKVKTLLWMWHLITK